MEWCSPIGRVERSSISVATPAKASSLTLADLAADSSVWDVAHRTSLSESRVANDSQRQTSHQDDPLEAYYLLKVVEDLQAQRSAASKREREEVSVALSEWDFLPERSPLYAQVQQPQPEPIVPSTNPRRRSSAGVVVTESSNKETSVETPAVGTDNSTSMSDGASLLSASRRGSLDSSGFEEEYSAAQRRARMRNALNTSLCASLLNAVEPTHDEQSAMEALSSGVQESRRKKREAGSNESGVVERAERIPPMAQGDSPEQQQRPSWNEHTNNTPPSLHDIDDLASNSGGEGAYNHRREEATSPAATRLLSYLNDVERADATSSSFIHAKSMHILHSSENDGFTTNTENEHQHTVQQSNNKACNSDVYMATSLWQQLAGALPALSDLDPSALANVQRRFAELSSEMIAVLCAAADTSNTSAKNSPHGVDIMNSMKEQPSTVGKDAGGGYRAPAAVIEPSPGYYQSNPSYTQHTQGPTYTQHTHERGVNQWQTNVPDDSYSISPPPPAASKNSQQRDVYANNVRSIQNGVPHTNNAPGANAWRQELDRSPTISEMEGGLLGARFLGISGGIPTGYAVGQANGHAGPHVQASSNNVPINNTTNMTNGYWSPAASPRSRRQSNSGAHVTDSVVSDRQHSTVEHSNGWASRTDIVHEDREVSGTDVSANTEGAVIYAPQPMSHVRESWRNRRAPSEASSLSSVSPARSGIITADTPTPYGAFANQHHDEHDYRALTPPPLTLTLPFENSSDSRNRDASFMHIDATVDQYSPVSSISPGRYGVITTDSPTPYGAVSAHSHRIAEVWPIRGENSDSESSHSGGGGIEHTHGIHAPFEEQSPQQEPHIILSPYQQESSSHRTVATQWQPTSAQTPAQAVDANRDNDVTILTPVRGSPSHKRTTSRQSNGVSASRSSGKVTKMASLAATAASQAALQAQRDEYASYIQRVWRGYRCRKQVLEYMKEIMAQEEVSRQQDVPTRSTPAVVENGYSEHRQKQREEEKSHVRENSYSAHVGTGGGRAYFGNKSTDSDTGVHPSHSPSDTSTGTGMSSLPSSRMSYGISAGVRSHAQADTSSRNVQVESGPTSRLSWPSPSFSDYRVRDREGANRRDTVPLRYERSERTENNAPRSSRLQLLAPDRLRWLNELKAKYITGGDGNERRQEASSTQSRQPRTSAVYSSGAYSGARRDHEPFVRHVASGNGYTPRQEDSSRVSYTSERRSAPIYTSNSNHVPTRGSSMYDSSHEKKGRRSPGTTPLSSTSTSASRAVHWDRTGARRTLG